MLAEQYETTSAQGIPHDIDIMHELWDVTSYQKRNKVHLEKTQESWAVSEGGAARDRRSCSSAQHTQGVVR